MSIPRDARASLGAALPLASVLLAACTGGIPPTASPSPTDSPTASATASASVSASPTELITFPPSPSPTVTLPPGVTPSASPTESASASPSESASPTTATAQIVLFRREDYPESQRNRVDCTRPDFNFTIHLVWEVRNATGVTLAIDGPGIYAAYSGMVGEVDVPFTCEPLQHTYTLTTTGSVGPDDSVTRTIRAAEPAIIEFFPSGGACLDASDSFPIYITYEIANATGVELRVDGEVYATYEGKTGVGLPAGTFDCANVSQEYVLTTTGGYGTPATSTLPFLGYD